MKRWVLGASVALVSAALLAFGAAAYLHTHQGLSAAEWREFSARTGTKVSFDAHGIPTVEAPSWPQVIEAQGYVVAAERMFHMDMLRRSASGELAELLGPDLVARDRGRRDEDWLGAAERAVGALPARERELVEAYTRGVNRFLKEHGAAAGSEYWLLRARPRPWTPRDTMLVFLMMCEQLSASAQREASEARWMEHLGADWFPFLFPEDHPWNQPYFGEPQRKGPALPGGRLPPAPIAPDELAALIAAPGEEEDTLGASNSWGWCRGRRCILANDPHLGATVPHLWFAMRLRVSAKDWAVGVAIPGIPSVILGMNPYLAWAFTNVGEDVDDYFVEDLSPDGKNYLKEVVAGEEKWAPVEERPYRIEVKGGAPVEGVARFTHRGPLAQRPHVEGWSSRMWLPLQPEMLRFTIGLPFARSWDEANVALDDFRVPAQNVLIADRRGQLGYRAGGTGLVRRARGRFPARAVGGEWAWFEDPSQRPRLHYYLRDGVRVSRSGGPTVTATAAVTSTVGGADLPRFLATANERIWVDQLGHAWAEDLRKERIRSVLSAAESFSAADASRLQLDTVSRYHRRLLEWVAEHSGADADAAPVLSRWKAWSGAAVDDPTTFTEALLIEKGLIDLCVGRVRRRFLPEAERDLPYTARLDSAWVLTAMDTPGGFTVFGFDEAELARALLARVRAQAGAPRYTVENRWQAQHPFARLPYVGRFFRVPEPEQPGWWTLVRVETPRYGASTRLVWDLGEPRNSTWSLPMGQSGHAGSTHFADLQPLFHAGKPLTVFAADEEWWFAPTEGGTE
jgi:penicillin amidase